MAKCIAQRQKPDFTAVVRQKLEPLQHPTKAMRYGLRNEETARMAYVAYQQEQHPGLKCSPVGFVIDPAHPWLGASPDSIVNDTTALHPTGLLEIKCPFVQHISLDEYITSKSSCLSSTKQLKRSHQYYFQIQVAMLVCNKQWCDLCVWAPNFLVIERIMRDEDLLARIMPKLEKFYFSNLLPALAAECQQII